MPYKDATKRREKQKELMRTLRAKSKIGKALPLSSCEPSELKTDLLHNVENTVVINKDKALCEPLPLSSEDMNPNDLFEWTIRCADGNKRKLEITIEMPRVYKYLTVDLN